MHVRQARINMIVLAALIALVAALRWTTVAPPEATAPAPLPAATGAPPILRNLPHPVSTPVVTGGHLPEADRIRLPGRAAWHALDIHVVARSGGVTPSAGVPVILRWEQMPWPGFFDVAWADAPLAHGTTDGEGRLTWKDLTVVGPLRQHAAQACLVVRAVSPWSGRQIVFGPADSDATHTWAFEAPVDPASGQASIEVELFTSRRRRVVGTVRREDGVPVPRARFLPDGGLRLETAADGTFDILVPHKDRTLRAYGPSLAGIPGVTQALPEAQDDEVTHLDFVLRGLGGIEVRLVDGEGRPRTSLQPWLVPAGTTLASQRWAQACARECDARHAPNPVGLEAQEQEDGVYVFATVPLEGAFDLRLALGEGARDVVVAQGLQAGAKNTFVVATDLVSITVHFVDAETQAPVGAAGTIHWMAEDATSLDGIATHVTRLIDAGTRPRVALSQPGYAPLSRTLEPTNESSAPVFTLALVPARGSRAVSMHYAPPLKGLGGIDLPPPRVEGADGGVWQPAWARTEEGWTTHDLPPGAYRLLAPPEVGGLAIHPDAGDEMELGADPDRGPLHLVCMPVTPLHVGDEGGAAVCVLRPAGALRVTYRDAAKRFVRAQGAPRIADASGYEQPLVLHRFWPGPFTTRWMADAHAQGGLTRGLAPGRYRIHASAEGRRVIDAEVTVEAGQIHDVALALER